MGYKKIKTFDGFTMLAEGRIAAYQPGDKGTASKSLSVPVVASYFFDLLSAGKPFTAVINNEGPEFDTPAGEPPFNRLESELDVVGMEEFGKDKKDIIKPIETAAEAKKVDPNKVLIVLRDKKGRKFKIQIGKIEEVAVGNSIQDKIELGNKYRADDLGTFYLYDYDGKDVTLKVKDGDTEKDVKMPYTEWKNKRKQTM